MSIGGKKSREWDKKEKIKIMKMTFDQAKNFMKTRKWYITEDKHKNNFCSNCNTYHPIAAENLLIGIHRFYSKKEFINWVKKLIPNSI